MAGAGAMLAHPLVAEAGVTPSLKNLLFSVVAGGFVLSAIAIAVTGGEACSLQAPIAGGMVLCNSGNAAWKQPSVSPMPLAGILCPQCTSQHTSYALV